MTTLNETTPTGAASAVMDAAGENRFTIGKVHLEGGTGSKTISAAGGGKILIRAAGTTVFNNAGSELRIGIQDVGAATGLPDGTFDVYQARIGGTDTWVSGNIVECAMSSGTKTLSENDIIAIGCELVTRGGTDSVATSVQSAAGLWTTNNFPYGVTNGVPTTTVSPVLIVFDDGTLGWIGGVQIARNYSNTPSGPAFNSGSTPDERAVVFKVPFKCTIREAMIAIGDIDPGDDFEVIWYEDPYGTPTIPTNGTLTPDPDIIGNTGGTLGNFWARWDTPMSVAANTWYAVALRPTTANNINGPAYDDLGSGNEFWKKTQPFGADVYLAGRTNQSGAFVNIQDYYLPWFDLRIDSLDDGAGGGDTTSHVFS